MIPHILSGAMYTAAIRLVAGPAFHGGRNDLSTMDNFRDAFAWLEGEGFQFALVPKSQRGSHIDVTAYINLDEDRQLADSLEAIHCTITAAICSHRRGLHVERFGKPRLLMHLDSIDGRIAQEEELRTEKLFTDIIDS